MQLRLNKVCPCYGEGSARLVIELIKSVRASTRCTNNDLSLNSYSIVDCSRMPFFTIEEPKFPNRRESLQYIFFCDNCPILNRLNNYIHYKFVDAVTHPFNILIGM